MAKRPREPAPSTDELSRRVAQLQDALRQAEEERDRFGRRRRRELLMIGVGISLAIHLGVLYFLGTQYRQTPGAAGPTPVSFEFAIVQEEELTELESTELEDLLPEVVSDFTEIHADESAAELEPVVTAADLEVADRGSVPTLGGGGDGGASVGGLAGGGAGTTFFGVSSRGTRFAYIVDRSASMGDDRKMVVAKRELAESISALPDFASLHIMFFSTQLMEPPGQRGWMRARRSTIHRLISWLNELDPGGGTKPVPAFVEILNFSVRPDVIFFLTDGEIPRNTADEIAKLNGRGERVIINTIAFGDASSQEQLQRIAGESGGVYRFVPSEGW